MFGLSFFKGLPTDYVIEYAGGRILRKGPGLAFYYLAFDKQIATIPMSSIDASFVFNEITSNFQAVTVQGQFTYRIANPEQAATLLNFTIDPRRRAYLSNDPERLPQRITNIIQVETRGEIQKRSLEATLREYETIAAEVLKRISLGELLNPMGVELLSIYFLSAKPTPEVAKALEADYRETLLRMADEAIYARRAAAVEEERKIKENELNTQITLEQQRQQFIELQGKNAEQEAEYRGKALQKEAEYHARAQEMELAPYRTFDARTLLALGIRELGENAGKIGNLTITSEILAALFDAQNKGK